MKKNILFRTNLMVCAVIVLGFVITSMVSYRSNIEIFRKDVESVSSLTSDGIYAQIEALFTRPVNVSLTMANDSLLKEFLAEEDAHLEDEAFIQVMRTYLSAYREKYGYDSVFLVSARTGRYYHFNGLDRVLAPGEPEDVWYYSFLEEGWEYSLNIDNDQAADNQITVFVNCRITGEDGATAGVVGVGFLVDNLQDMLREYEEQFGVRAYLVDGGGMLEVSTDSTGYQQLDFFASCPYPEFREDILRSGDELRTFWYGSGYVVARYVPTLDWRLIVENDTTTLDRQLNLQLLRGVTVIAAIVAFVLFIITSVIRKCNAQIIQLTMERAKEHRDMFLEATEQLYENIYELDVTHNRVANEATEQYFESLGVPKHTPLDQALVIIAQKQVKEEYRQGYLDTFSPASVLRAFEAGTDTLRYDFMISRNGKSYYWMRIIAKLFRWDEDGSVRMLTYHQNIDEERRHEEALFEQMQRDSLTGLYNKAATQEHIRARLARRPGAPFAFFILDIDNFKGVNDQLGHAMGDSVLTEFAQTIRSQFRDDDVVGRIGGDEFVAFFPITGREAAEKRARALSAALDQEVAREGCVCRISASIGVSLSPEAGADFEALYRHADTALYQTKANGKNGFTVYKAE